MADRELAESLYATDPNLTWETMIQKQRNKGLAGDDIYKAIYRKFSAVRNKCKSVIGYRVGDANECTNNKTY